MKSIDWTGKSDAISSRRSGRASRAFQRLNTEGVGTLVDDMKGQAREGRRAAETAEEIVDAIDRGLKLCLLPELREILTLYHAQH